MSLHVKVNIQSVRKYPGVSVCAQIVTSDKDDNQAFYGCRIIPTGFDSENIYQFVDSRWQKVTLTDELIAVLEASLNALLKIAGHALKRKTKDSKGRECLVMYRDAIISVGVNLGGHYIKIGDRLFETHSSMDITQNGVGNKNIPFSILGTPRLLQRLSMNLDDYPDIKARLQKQFNVARSKSERIRDSQPIGGMSWASAQDDRKEFGRSSCDNRQLQRGR